MEMGVSSDTYRFPESTQPPSGKARGVLDIHKSLPAKNKVAAITAEQKKLPYAKKQKNRRNGNPI